MASDYYLLIDKITGESQAQGMTKNIELDSFSFGASNPPDVGGSGLSGGKCSLSDFSFSCALDSSSFQMLTDLYAGTHIATCTFTGRKSRRRRQPLQLLSRHPDQLLHYQPKYRRRCAGNADSKCQHCVRTDPVRILYSGYLDRCDQVGWLGDLQHCNGDAVEIRTRVNVVSGIRRHLHGRRLVRREGASYLIATRRAVLLGLPVFWKTNFR